MNRNCEYCGRDLNAEYPEHHTACLYCLQEDPAETRHMARTYDPPTSHEAAVSVDANALEQLVYDAIYDQGPYGLIADDLLEMFPDLSYSSITARPSALKRKELITTTGERRPGRTGRRQMVLVATCFIKQQSA